MGISYKRFTENSKTWLLWSKIPGYAVLAALTMAEAHDWESTKDPRRGLNIALEFTAAKTTAALAAETGSPFIRGFLAIAASEVLGRN